MVLSYAVNIPMVLSKVGGSLVLHFTNGLKIVPEDGLDGQENKLIKIHYSRLTKENKLE